MYKPFNLRALLLASLLTSACGGDLSPTDTDLDNVDPSEEEALPIGHDAGATPIDGGTQSDAGTFVEHDSALGRDSAVANAEADAGFARDAGRVEDAGRPRDAGADARTDAASGDTCSTLSYETFGKSFIQQYCLSCHAGAGVKAISLDSLAKVQQRAASVKSQVVTRMAMPERNAIQPSPAERQKLGQWIDCGAK